MEIQPASAACQPYVPPLIQWLVLRKATNPIPWRLANSMARFVHFIALMMPGPRFPSHLSMLPKVSTLLASAPTFTRPFSTNLIKSGTRFTPWELTPSNVLSVNTLARIVAFSWVKHCFMNKVYRTSCICSLETRIVLFVIYSHFCAKAETGFFLYVIWQRELQDHPLSHR